MEGARTGGGEVYVCVYVYMYLFKKNFEVDFLYA